MWALVATLTTKVNQSLFYRIRPEGIPAPAVLRPQLQSVILYTDIIEGTPFRKQSILWYTFIPTFCCTMLQNNCSEVFDNRHNCPKILAYTINSKALGYGIFINIIVQLREDCGKVRRFRCIQGSQLLNHFRNFSEWS